MSLSRVEIDGIGYAAATMTTVSFVPQLLRVIRLRSAQNISLGMFFDFFGGDFCVAAVWSAGALGTGMDCECVDVCAVDVDSGVEAAV